MNKAAEKIAKLMGQRLVYAAGVQKSVINEFEGRYSKYVYGAPYLATEDERAEYFAKQGEGSDADRIKKGWDTTTLPLHGILRGVMMPYLLARDPVWINRERKGADVLERARVDLYADLSGMVWEECGTTAEVQRALDDAFCYRLGWANTVWDNRLKLPRHQWVDARDILLDCETRSPRMVDRRWIAEKMILPIETAEWFAKNVWDAAKHEFEEVAFDDASGMGEEAKRRVRGASSQESSEEDAPSKFARLIMVQVKGENPYTQSSSLKSKRNNDSAGTDDVYDGKDHVLVMEACHGYEEAKAYKLVARIDWPFPCKPGQFTYTPFMLTRDNRSVYPYSIMQPGHSSQVAADIALQAWNTDSRNSARRWGAMDPTAFNDESDMDRVIESDDALVMARLKPGSDPNRAIAIGNFGSPNQHLNQTFAMNRGNYEAVEGMNKFDVDVRANQTAYNTAKQSESAQVKLEDLAQLVEASVVELAEKGVMCARANMTLEDVSRWINVPETIIGDAAEEVQVAIESTDSKGKIVVENVLWPDNPDWDDIRRETEVNLEPRSIRFHNPEKEAADIKEIADYQMQVARIIGDTIGKGGVAAAQEIARTANETMKMIATLKNVANYERLLFDFTKISAPTPPPIDPNTMIEAGTEMQGNMINAQQQAAATRMTNQGVDPSVMPDMGG